jgi:hypothetical protein
MRVKSPRGKKTTLHNGLIFLIIRNILNQSQLQQRRLSLT